VLRKASIAVIAVLLAVAANTSVAFAGSTKAASPRQSILTGHWGSRAVAHTSSLRRPRKAKTSRHRKAKTSGHHKVKTSRHSVAKTSGLGKINNVFGQSLFGLATGSTLQNEAQTPALASDLNTDREAGAHWIRIDINWAQIQEQGPSSYYWTAIDTAVRKAESDGMQVLGTIVFTPSWARPENSIATYGPDPSQYAKFAGEAARHYAALGVQAYEIWNEPNSQAFWTPRPNPAAYTAVLKAAYTAIKSADPGATVMTGGTSPAADDGTNYTPVTFLSDIYRDGGQGYFDAVANHPYCWPAYPGAAADWSAWYQMYGTHPSMHSLMVDHRDGSKKIWATEFGAPTDGPAGTYVSDATQAKMVAKAYQLFAGYKWAGPLFMYSGRDLGNSTDTRENFFGFLKHNFTRKPSFAAYHRAMLSVRDLVSSSSGRRSRGVGRAGKGSCVTHGNLRAWRMQPWMRAGRAITSWPCWLLS
jgi:polysaccharide biosynthesis protein PslG